jgi:hypothetical protein
VTVVLGVLLPWLVALAVPAAAALVLTRLVRTASGRRKSPSSA